MTLALGDFASFKSFLDGNAESLRRAADRLGAGLQHLFMSPAKPRFIQAAKRPFQANRHDDFGSPCAVGPAAKDAGGLPDAQPRRSSNEPKAGLLNVPETRRFF